MDQESIAERIGLRFENYKKFFDAKLMLMKNQKWRFGKPKTLEEVIAKQSMDKSVCVFTSTGDCTLKNGSCFGGNYGLCERYSPNLKNYGDRKDEERL